MIDELGYTEVQVTPRSDNRYRVFNDSFNMWSHYRVVDMQTFEVVEGWPGLQDARRDAAKRNQQMKHNDSSATDSLGYGASVPEHNRFVVVFDRFHRDFPYRVFDTHTYEAVEGLLTLKLARVEAAERNSGEV